MASENIGKLLREARINANISVEEISEALISLGFKAGKNTIYSWENGNSQPTPDALLYMCKRYHIRDILDYFGYKAPNTTLEMILTNPHEQKVITAYRAQPKMQEPVDRLLGIFEANDDKDPKTKKTVIIDSNLAAHGGGLLKAPSPPVDEHHKKVAEELEYGDD